MSLTPPPSASPLASSRLLLALAAVLSGLLWLPALSTPFWGDDYGALGAARLANQAGQSWWQTFFPATPLPFWRPLSQDAYWRLVESLGAGPRLAHVLNLVLLALAAAAVGLLGAALARACAWPRAAAVGCAGGALYALLALHFLPVHWAAAANSSLSVLCSALLLGAWLEAGQRRGGARAALLLALPLLQALALLSKESAVLLPGLMLVLWLFAGRARPRRGEVLGWLACALVALAWLWLDRRIALNQDPAYQLRLGGNVLRNAVALGAWLLNIPREALRLALEGQAGRAALWAAGIVLPLLLALGLAAWRGRWRPTPRQGLLAAGFVGLAYAPYFLLAWNSYAYYAATAVVLPVLLLARAVAGTRRAPLVLVLLGLSSLLAVEGSRRLEHPALVGRARWAQQVLDGLEPGQARAPLEVLVEDEQRFYAIGVPGLAWRLGLAPEQVRPVPACTHQAGSCLRLGADGSASWLAPPP